MIIENIHIDGFGKFCDFSLDFSNGFNLIFGNNEDGKTTVMSFIRLMFYGSGTQKSDINFNLRKRYEPFGGEKMGGSIIFSHDGKKYCLQKLFGKTPKSDKTVLTDLSLGSAVELPAGKDIGEMFFGISAGAFERSIYIGSLPPFSDGGTQELSDRLAAAAGTGETADGYEQIKSRLDKAIATMRTPRKVGTADHLESEISALKSELETAKENEKRRLDAERQLSETEKEIAYLTRKCAELEEKAEKQKAIKERAALLSEHSLRREQNALCDEIGTVTREDCNGTLSLLRERALLSATLNATEPVPFDDTERVNTTETALCEAQKRMATLDGRLSELTEKISLSEEKLDSIEKSKSANSALLFAAAGIFAATGIVGSVFALYFLFLLIPAGILTAAAFLSASKQKSAAETKEKLRLELLSLKEQKQTLAGEKADAEKLFTVLTERLRIILADKEEKNRQNDAQSAKVAELKAKIESIDNLLSKTAVKTEESAKNMLSLFARLDSLNAKRSAGAFFDLDDAALEQRIANYSDVGDGEEYNEEELRKQLAETRQKAEQLRLKKEREQTLCETDFSRVRGVSVVERNISEKEELLSRQNAHFSALNIAKDVLAEAYTEMRQTFAPELNRLTGEIFSALSGNKYSGVTVSNDLSLTVKEKGSPLSTESGYLSAGSRDQADLSLRLAVAKLTAGDTALPLLLDDVLCQYDDDRAATALDFLADYAKNTQVLFFTCHGSIKALAKDKGTVISLSKQ